MWGGGGGVRGVDVWCGVYVVCVWCGGVVVEVMMVVVVVYVCVCVRELVGWMCGVVCVDFELHFGAPVLFSRLFKETSLPKEYFVQQLNKTKTVTYSREFCIKMPPLFCNSFLILNLASND